MLSHWGLSDCWGSSYNIKHIEVAVVVIWGYIPKIELKLIESVYIDKHNSFSTHLFVAWDSALLVAKRLYYDYIPM